MTYLSHVTGTCGATLGCVVPKMKDLIVPIDNNCVDVRRDFCSKCPKFSEPLDTYDQLRGRLKRTPTTREVEEFMQSNSKCGGGEKMLKKGCLQNIKYEDAYIRASQAVINTPTLDFCNYISFRVASTSMSVSPATAGRWKLNAIRNKPDSVERTPYRIGNVYDTGNICWGSRRKPPKSPAEAFKVFFSSPFNGDLTILGSGFGVKANIESVDIYQTSGWEEHPLTDVKDQKDNVVKLISKDYGNKQIVKLSGDCSGILIFTTDNFLSLAPSESKLSINGRDVVLARAITSGKSFIFTFGDGKLYKAKALTAKSVIEELPDVGRLISPFSNKTRNSSSVKESRDEV